MRQCAFWFNQYNSNYVMQPVVFTALAILEYHDVDYSKEKPCLRLIGIWFLSLLPVVHCILRRLCKYGVDWRFMLSLVAQASILGGFAAAEIVDLVNYYAKKLIKNPLFINGAALVILLFVIFFPIYKLMPLLSIRPSAIQQAGDARFDENFVYNSSYLIPTGCIVYSYDPTLFQLNNRTSTQMEISTIRHKLANICNSTGALCLIMDIGAIRQIMSAATPRRPIH